jgi:hypothetical protein
MSQTSSISRRSLLEWTTLVASFTLMCFAIFMIVSGSCSLFKKKSLCFGNKLSVQEWLAIVGVEFALFGSITLPWTRSIFLSKRLTKRLLSEDGVALSSILNLQGTAPMRNQFSEGWRRALLRHFFVPALVTLGSILYKFSFITATINSIFQLDCGLVPLGGTALGWTVFSDNIIDLAEPGRAEAVSIGRNGSDLIVGPSFNYTRALRADYGSDLFLCYPTLYARSNFSTTNDTEWMPTKNFSQETTPGSIRFTSTSFGQVVEVSISESEGLQALAGPGSNNDSSWKYQTNITTLLCFGYLSWTKLNSTEMNNPEDIICTNERFDLVAWNTSVSQIVAWGVVESRLANKNISEDYLNIHVSKNTTGEEDYDAAYVLYVVVESILASFNHTIAIEALFPPSRNTNGILGTEPIYEPASHECQSRGAVTPEVGYSQAGLMVIDGDIEGYGSGMTMIGMALQIILLGVALAAMRIVACGARPLVKEWPAQWINLVSQLDKEILMNSLEGTSTGENSVTGNTRVFICSMTRHGQPPRLVLSTSPGDIDRDVYHA